MRYLSQPAPRRTRRLTRSVRAPRARLPSAAEHKCPWGRSRGSSPCRSSLAREARNRRESTRTRAPVLCGAWRPPLSPDDGRAPTTRRTRRESAAAAATRTAGELGSSRVEYVAKIDQHAGGRSPDEVPAVGHRPEMPRDPLELSGAALVIFAVQQETQGHFEDLRHLVRVRPKDKRGRNDPDDRRHHKTGSGNICIQVADHVHPPAVEANLFFRLSKRCFDGGSPVVRFDVSAGEADLPGMMRKM